MFKRLLTTTLAVLIPITSFAGTSVGPDERPKAPARYIVKNDPGGSVNEFVQMLIYARNNKMTFKIDGYCASACTLILATPLKLDVCVTEKAVFKFHQPYAAGMGGIAYSLPYVIGAQQLWDNLFLANYPKFIQDLIKANGGVPNVYQGAKPSDTFDVGFEHLKKNMPVCQ